MKKKRDIFGPGNDLAFQLENLKVEFERELKDVGNELSEGVDTYRDIKPLRTNSISQEHETVLNQIGLFLDKLRLKHFEDMESVESLIRSSASKVEMGH
jgi:hypothetical protein